MSVFRDKIQTIKESGLKAALFSKLGIDTIGDALKFSQGLWYRRQSKIDSIKEEGMVSLCLEWKGTPKVKG